MITPLRKRVILQPLEDKQSGSILIPENSKQQQTGRVMAVGDGLTFPVKVGQTVLFHPNAAWTNIEHEGEQLRVMNAEFLLAVMETT